MKKLILGVIFLSLLTVGGCTITLDEAKASSVDCESMENNLTIISNQLGKLQTENDEQKAKINELEKICKDNDILSGEIKKLNKKISELEKENKKFEDENTELKDENKKLKDENTELNKQNKQLSEEKEEIETDYSGSKSKIANYIGIIKKLRDELSELKNEVNEVQVDESTGAHGAATQLSIENSKNKIETNYIYTPECEYTTLVMSENNTWENMPNENWTDDMKFINNILQDVQDNGEDLVIKYINEANDILDSNLLTKREQCRYSLLIDILKNQKGIVDSYKYENGKIIIGINFIQYKENITWDDWLQYLNGGTRDIEKDPSSETKYYTLSDNPELETLNVNKNGYLIFSGGSNTIFINDRYTRINKFCNDEPVYTELLVGDLAIHDTLGQFYNQNNGHYCIKDRLDTRGARFMFDFDEKGNIKKIKAKYNIVK